MALQITFQQKENYAQVSVEGSYDAKRAKSAVIELIDYAIQHDKNRILVDYVKMEGQPTLNQSFDYVLFLVTQFRKKIYENGILGMRMAYVGRDSNGRFGEMVASNRGVAARYFTDLDKAVAWLSEVSRH
jgi:hypothetical protein